MMEILGQPLNHGSILTLMIGDISIDFPICTS